MKKKLIALIIVVLMLSTVFVGCTMFTLDDERDYNQVVGSVSYNGMTDKVVKGELMAMVATYGGIYVQYQGMTYPQVTEFLYNDLIKQKLTTLFAKEYIAANGIGITATDDKAVVAAMSNKQFLTVDERRFSIETTNKSMRDSWQAEVDKLVAQDKVNQGDNEEDEEEDEETEELAARPIKEIKESEEKEKYIDMGMTDETLLPKSFLDTVSEEIKTEKDDNLKRIKKDALKNIKSNLKKSFVAEADVFEDSYESRIVEKYKEKVGNDIASSITSAEILNKLNAKIATDKDSYKKIADYNTAMTGEKQPFSFYHAAEGYFNVKSLLLKFSEAQTSALKLTQTKYPDNKKFTKEYREKLALEFVTMDFAKGGIKVNVSNPNYKDGDDIKTAYTDKDVDYRVVLYAMAEDIAAKTKVVEDKVNADAKYSDLEKKLIIEQAQKDAFTDWIYLVNDDDGMFKSEYYTVTPEAKESSFVEEYTVFTREMYKQNAHVGVKTVPEVSTDGDAKFGGALAYTGETNILKVANGKTATIKFKNYTQKNEKGEDISTVIYTLTTESNNAISFIVNEFGIHIVMINSIPLNKDYAQAGYVADGEGFSITGSFLYSSSVTITYKKDADGKKTAEIDKIVITKQTVDEYFKETMKTARANDVYTKKQIELMKKEENIAKNKSVYDKIMKEVGKISTK